MHHHLPTLAAILVAALAPLAALAQSAPPHQPYANHAGRAVTSLSEQQIADLKQGRGMGLALPAELNGYPGPLHVIEHATALQLTPLQRQQSEALFAAMKAETIPLGERLIGLESDLDRLFAGRTATRAGIASLAQAIGATQAALRAAHLGYHLAMMEILSPEQVRRYGALRGYGGGSPQGHGGHGTHK